MRLSAERGVYVAPHVRERIRRGVELAARRRIAARGRIHIGSGVDVFRGLAEFRQATGEQLLFEALPGVLFVQGQNYSLELTGLKPKVSHGLKSSLK